MSTEAVLTPAEQTESLVKAEANRIIKNTAAKHGISESAIPEDARNDAFRVARETVKAEQDRSQNPLYAELKQAQEQLRVKNMQLEAIKAGRVNAANDRQPAITVEVARARLGESTWNLQLTDAGRLQAIGVDPASVNAGTKAEILELFGPRSDSHAAGDAFKTNPVRYRQLREIGRCMRWI